MTIEVGYLQGDGTGPEHSAHLMRQVQAGFTSEGIARTNDADDLLVTQDTGSDMKVKVAKGVAFIEGDQVTDQGLYSFVSDASETVNVTASDPTNPRIDIVVAQVSDTFYGDPTDEGTILVIEGTPDPAPDPPATPDSALLLATVDVGAGVTAIHDADITDERVRMGGGGTGALRATVVLSSNWATTNDVENSVPWDAAEEDVGDWWSSGDKTKLFAPKACVVIAGAQIVFEADAGGKRRACKITKGASFTLKGHVQDVEPGGGWSSDKSPVLQVVTKPIALAAGEYLQARPYQDSGGPLDVMSSESHFWVLVVG